MLLCARNMSPLSRIAYPGSSSGRPSRLHAPRVSYQYGPDRYPRAESEVNRAARITRSLARRTSSSDPSSAISRILRLAPRRILRVRARMAKAKVSADCKTLYVRQSVWNCKEQDPKTENALEILTFALTSPPCSRTTSEAGLAVSYSMPIPVNLFCNETSCVTA